MTENIKKEINDTKISTDTLFVLLLVICGFATIIFVAYLLLYKPHQPVNDVVIRDIVVAGVVPEDRGNIESIEKSLENSYLSETEEPVEVLPVENVDAEIVKAEVATEVKSEPIESKPIFKPNNNATIKQTPVKTTVVKKVITTQKKLINVKAFWIQVGSFSSSSQASKSVELLKEKGLSSRVVLKTVNGNSVYRVRIGAYESREEAERFCAEVKKIKGYDGSYISETTTQKYIEI